MSRKQFIKGCAVTTVVGLALCMADFAIEGLILRHGPGVPLACAILTMTISAISGMIAAITEP